MRPQRFRHAACAAIAAATFISTAGAQQRRSANPGGPPLPPPTGVAANARFPFVGVWRGTRQFEAGPGSDAPDDMELVFVVSDSAKPAYDGAQVMPGGGRIPFPGATLAAGALTWTSPNSGGGTWTYTAKIAGRDTLSGRMVLRGAPWNPSPEPAVAFTLVRLKPGTR
jgi:hypothetical protein